MLCDCLSQIFHFRNKYQKEQCALIMVTLCPINFFLSCKTTFLFPAYFLLFKTVQQAKRKWISFSYLQAFVETRAL